MAFDAGCKAKGWMIRSVPGLAVAAMLAAVVLLPGPVVAQDQAAEAVPAEVAAQVDALLEWARLNVDAGQLATAYEGVQRGGNQGTILVPGKAAESRLYLTLTGAMEPVMPMGAARLPAAKSIHTRPVVR